MSSNIQIEKFLEEIKNISPMHYEMISNIRNIILSYPNISEEFKYWGIIFNKWTEWMNGIFFYKTYVSLEFGKWYLLDDRDKLEWNGKFRRHIKLYEFSDIRNKEVHRYVDEIYLKL